MSMINSGCRCGGLGIEPGPVPREELIGSATQTIDALGSSQTFPAWVLILAGAAIWWMARKG